MYEFILVNLLSEKQIFLLLEKKNFSFYFLNKMNQMKYFLHAEECSM